MKIQELNSYMVVFHDDKVLVLKRTNGFWEFPGGGVNWGEDPRQTAIRETKEETGLDVTDVSFVTTTSATYEKNGNDKHSVYLVYRGNAQSKEVRLTEEHTEYRWLNLLEAKYVKLALNAEGIVELLR